MSPFETARRLTWLRGGKWPEELEAFGADGFIVSTPEVFAMGRMCAKSDHLPDPWEPWPDGDAFFCWVAVGDVRKILAHLPGNPAHVGWFRQGRGWGRNHWMPAERFKSAIAFADANC